ncbi:transcriptional regulator [Nitrosomonas supralitoralis]|uniref:Transcriptional regulator n=1 Tax=Nitrosomonas supralitoralis TaxID=2116706 RepID=A0A2P7NSU3_9PROT|nr:transcriptional regulator [Nitrosomonas supralitoralis]
MYNQIFLTNVIRVLDELNMTKIELAEKANISLSFLSDLTKDRANPSLRIMEAIANALETPLPILLEQTNLSEAEMKELMSVIPKSNLPEGLVRVCGTLTKFQAYQVHLWDTENKKQVLTHKKRKEK